MRAWASLVSRLRFAFRGERGATGVEYALIFTFLVVLSIGGAKAIQSAGTAEVNNEAACVATRPPPVSCQLKPVVTPAPTSSIVVTSTVPPTSVAPTTVPAPSVGSFAANKVSSPRGVNPSLVVLQAGSPVPNVIIQFTITVTAPGNTVSFVVSCTTNASGTCNAPLTSPYSDATSINVTVTSVGTSPAPTLPGPQTVTFP